jgi:hypothetical protein
LKPERRATSLGIAAGLARIAKCSKADRQVMAKLKVLLDIA